MKKNLAALSPRAFRKARFPKVYVYYVGEDGVEDQTWCAFRYHSPTSGTMVTEGTLDECTEAAQNSGLPWTDCDIGSRRLPYVRNEDADTEDE